MLGSRSPSHENLELPNRVWESVIDYVAGSDPTVLASRENLYACALVCRAWVPRSSFWLFKTLTLRKASHLENAVLRMANTPRLAQHVEFLLIKCLPSRDLSWVSIVPLYLPRMENLKKLVLIGFDFTKRNPNFYEVYRLFKVEHLNIADSIYSRYSQITQLAISVSAQKLDIRTQAQPHLAPTNSPGRLRFATRSNLRTLLLQTKWCDLQEISKHWIFPPSLRRVEIFIKPGGGTVDEEPAQLLQGDSIATWKRIAELHCYVSSCGEPIIGDSPVVFITQESGVLCGMRMDANIASNSNSQVVSRRMLDIFFCGKHPQIVVDILEGVSRIVDGIFLPHMHDGTASQFWRTIDNYLAHPTLANIEYCNIKLAHAARRHVETHPVVDTPFQCLHEEYRERMPQAAYRGFFRCNLRTCKLRRAISPLSTACRLPVEVWEQIIDYVAGPLPDLWAVRENLFACALVCRAWVPRSFWWLFKTLTLKSALQLEYAVSRMANISGLSQCVEFLVVLCLPSQDMSWVSLVPLYLPRLENLQKFILIQFDFTKRSPRFYDAYRLLKVEHLKVVDPIYLRHNQITQLVVAVSAKTFDLTGRESSASQLASARSRSDRLLLGTGSNLQTFFLRTTWQDLQDISRRWAFPPTLRCVSIFITPDRRTSTEVKGFAELLEGDSVATWERIALLHDYIFSLEERGKGGIVGSSSYVSIKWNFKPLCGMRRHIMTRPSEVRHRRVLDIFFCGEHPQIVVDILRGLSALRYPFHTILLPHMHDRTASQFWSTIDDRLAHPGLVGVEYCNIKLPHPIHPHVEEHPVVNAPFDCLHEEYKARMPRAASQGFFRCTKVMCKLRRTFSMDLPAGVWDRVIDFVAGPDPILWKVRMDLYACALVCRAWAPRSSFWLFKTVTIRTALQLQRAASRMANTPGLSQRVEFLVVSCIPSRDMSWVSLVPLHLPALGNLKELIVYRFDFAKRNPNFYEVYRLFKVKYLEVWDCIYTRYTQSTQLATAVSAESFTINGRAQSPLALRRSPGSLLLGTGSNSCAVQLHTTWHNLQAISKHWRLRSTLRRVQISITSDAGAEREDPVELLQGDSAATWERIASLHLSMSSFEGNIMVRWNGSSLCGMRWYAEKGPEPNSEVIHRRILDVFFCGEHPQIVLGILRGVSALRSSCPLYTIFLPYMHDGTASQHWSSIDHCLALASVKICNITLAHANGSHSEKHPVVDAPFRCLHEEYRERMPRAASRGFFRCNPVETCELRRTANVLHPSSPTDS
ncbi:hypothetical protein BXZ70DRAFT_1011349 [Cristinia sonorae]|uniref:F-box domain-containing protein n=1 Tax=Cristinia sonorae TaxID=1940300 RepID=A0A8K0UGL2_9AGAR|nr:hypothetical protein BXZ70DRAFT_1011349 [Cristinia sonorae]